MKTVFMFSGQGSQYYHMGSKLFETDAVFRKHMYDLDDVVKSIQGRSLVGELYHQKHKLSNPFTSLQQSHPAIFMVEYALTKSLEKRGIVPDYLLGCSLGEFTAAALSGVLDPQEALKSIMQQAAMVEENCQEGRLIAVLNELSTYHETPEINNYSTLASINASSQFVIAGGRDNMGMVKNFMKGNDILHQELMVAYGFHSSAIDPAERAYKGFLEKQDFNQPKTPLISATTGQQLHTSYNNYFWDVVRKPILFTQTIQALEDKVDKNEDIMYIDIGPAGSLANLIKYNVNDTSRSKGFQIMSPFQQELKKLEEVTAHYEENKTETISMPSFSDGPLRAYAFPGQGSQKKGMGGELFDAYPEITDKASNILGYSVKELCLEDPNRNLNKTQYTQPALYVANALSYLKLKEETGFLPHFVVGHSLGEYSALFAAEAYDFETGLRLVQKRGALMAQMKEGGMAAVKGLSGEQIQNVINQNGLDEIDMANYNSQNQIVLSGPRTLITKSGPHFEAAGATLYFPLNVSGAFHSRYMMPAKLEFEQFLQQFNFSPLKIPVVSNVEASFYPDHNIPGLLADQLIKPVRWMESIAFLMEKGDVEFKEVGPGEVLTKLIFGIKKGLQQPIAEV